MSAGAARAWVVARWRSIAEPAALYGKIVLQPEQVRTLAFGEGTFRPQVFFLASVSMPSALIIWAIGGNPDSQLYTPPYLGGVTRFLEWLVPIGLPISMAALLFLSSLLTFAIVRIVGVKVGFATLWKLALIDAGVGTFILIGCGLFAVPLALAGASIAALILFLAFSLYLFRWRYVQFRWISGLGPKAAFFLTLAATVASSAPYAIVNHRVLPLNVSVSAMEPTMLPGDLVLVDRYEGYLTAPSVGEIFYLCRVAEECVIRRLVAVGGQVVQFRAGLLYVNGIPWTQVPAGTFGVCIVRGIVNEQLIVEMLPNQKRHYISHYRLYGSNVAAPRDLMEDWTRLEEGGSGASPAPGAPGEPPSATEISPSGGGLVLAPLRQILDSPPIPVPPGKYLFASDVRAAGVSGAPLILATDAHIVGRVFFRVWPFRLPLDEVSSEGVGRIDPSIAGYGQGCPRRGSP